MRLYSTKIRTILLSSLTFLATIVYVRVFRDQTPLTWRLGKTQPALPWVESSAYVEVAQPEDELTWPYRVFKSSTLRPPNFTISRNAGELSDGLFVVTAKSRGSLGLHQSSGLIFSADNEPVFILDGGNSTNDLKVQRIEDKHCLTFWQGKSVLGHGYGELSILNSSYERMVLDTLRDQANWSIPPNITSNVTGMMDFHEQHITARGTVLVTAYNSSAADLSGMGGPVHGFILDSLIYEINLSTGEVVFIWSALEHISVDSSRLPIESYQGDGSPSLPWDFFHINSIQDLGTTGLLISARHTWSVYLLSRETGSIVWQLSGEGSNGDFGPLPEEGRFRWQHDAQAHNVTDHSIEISMFDNHNMHDETGITSSRGLLLAVALPPDKRNPPRVLRSVSADSQFSENQGSYDAALSNGNQLIGYGPVPILREHSSAKQGSELLWEARFGHDNHAQSYRVFKSEWHATPRLWNPSLAIEEGAEIVTAYVSWNGATDIDSWEVLAGEDKLDLKSVAQVSKQGFETIFRLQREGDHCFQVAAMSQGVEIRKSNIACGNSSLSGKTS